MIRAQRDADARAQRHRDALDDDRLFHEEQQFLRKLANLLDLADTGIRQLFVLQRGLVGQYLGK